MMNSFAKIIIFLIILVQTVFAAPKFLTISDIHYGSNNVSKDGLDTGPEFLTITLERLRQFSQDVDFIINLGDLPTHAIVDRSKKEAYETTLFHRLYEADSALKPMFYVTGNNDSLTGNYQPFEVDGKSPLTLATDWQGACVYCKGLAIDDSLMRQAGYYSTYVMPNNKDIILIALNSVQWTQLPLFFPSYPNQKEDAAKQFAWLEKQLKSNQAKQLLLAMHVPPGNNYLGMALWKDAYLKQFIELLDKYHQRYGQISLLVSHTHMDEIRKIKLTDGTPVFIYSTPAISRVHHNNPGLKLFSLDKQDQIENFTTYYTSSLTQWGDEQYQALGSSEAMFPNCRNETLAQCLSDMTRGEVCKHIEQGLFYGVKSSKVPNQLCLITYSIN